MSADYGPAHRKERARWAKVVAAGDAYCVEPICKKPHRWIAPDEPWHLSHDRASGEWIGPSHRRCNTAEGATYGNRARRRRWVL